MHPTRLTMTLLLAASIAVAPGCKRKPIAPPMANTRPRTPGPTAQEIKSESLAKLREQLDEVPPLGEGVNYTDPNGDLWIRFPSGLMIRELGRGEGEMPGLGQTVSVAYIGTLPASKREFDRRGVSDPLVFRLGSKDLVKGFNMGVSTMRVGGKRRVFIPSDLAYGEAGKPGAEIAGNQALIFELELLSVKGEVITIADLPKVEPMGPVAPSTAGAPATTTAPGH